MTRPLGSVDKAESKKLPPDQKIYWLFRGDKNIKDIECTPRKKLSFDVKQAVYFTNFFYAWAFMQRDNHE